MQTRARLRRTVFRCVVAVLVISIAACVMQAMRVQDWPPDLGPVVPHDSFPADCALCHQSDAGWHTIKKDFQFDHGAATGVELAGAHASAPCLLCHNDRGPVAQFANLGCRGCHEDVHLAQLGDDCERCHVETSWQPQGMIAEHARTRFPLVGAHAGVACSRCHQGAETGQFTRVDTECEACHSQDALAATSFDHVAGNATQDCGRCHLPTAWSQVRFAHTSSFPLTGGHAGLDCSACHTTPGTFGGLSTDCVSCHLDDYNAADDPPHAGAGFSTDCADCHNTTSFGDGVFTHSFPITAGPHSGFDCSDCHTVPGAFPLFSCIDCHEHNQADTDDDHDEVRDYIYSSPSCLSCHPDGRE